MQPTAPEKNRSSGWPIDIEGGGQYRRELLGIPKLRDTGREHAGHHPEGKDAPGGEVHGVHHWGQHAVPARFLPGADAVAEDILNQGDAALCAPPSGLQICRQKAARADCG
jgi:hypothetical protein